MSIHVKDLTPRATRIDVTVHKADDARVKV